MPLIFLLAVNLFFDTSKVVWTTPPAHDFGEILRGSDATFTFTFRNVSPATLTLDNVRTECSCTATDWDAAPIAPNESGKITVSFDTKKVGFFKKKMTVWIRGQRKPEKISIEGEVIE